MYDRQGDADSPISPGDVLSANLLSLKLGWRDVIPLFTEGHGPEQKLRLAPIHEVDDDLWDRVFRINVTALMRLTRAVVPLMLETGTGSVVNVAILASDGGWSAL